MMIVKKVQRSQQQN